MSNQTSRRTLSPLSLFNALALALLVFGCAAATRAQTDPVYSLPDAAAGARYDEDIPVAGVRVVKFEVVKGSLPPGIDLGQTTGHLFGTATDVETKSYVFTVRVTDSAKKTTDFQLELIVKGGTPTLLLPVKGQGGRAGGSTTARAGSRPPARPVAEEEEDKPEGEGEGGKSGGDQAAAKPSVDSPLTEGVTTVKGFVPAEGVKSVLVDVFPASTTDAKLATAKPLRTHPATPGEGGRFSVSVEAPLTRGQKVRVRAVPTDAKKKALTSDVATVERETRIQTTLIEGLKEIKGTADQKAGQVYVEEKDGEGWRQIGVGQVNADTGAFTITLENALKRNAELRFYREGATPAVLEVADTTPPDLKPSLLEGARTVSGYSKARSGKVEVQVLPEVGADVTHERALHQTPPTTVNSETGEFNVTLPQGLTAGQRVRARVENTDTWSEMETVETLGDWGRVRGYFGIGLMLSKDADQSFSRRDLFLNFNIDSNWYHRPHYKSFLKDAQQRELVNQFISRFSADEAGQGDPAKQAIAAEKAVLEKAMADLDRETGLGDEERMATRRLLLRQSLERLKSSRLLNADRVDRIDDILKMLERPAKPRWDVNLNTFFEARLTPVAVTGQGTAAGGTGSDAFGNFVSNEKGALMQFGTYAPIFHHGAMTWNYQGSRNALFFGPVGRVGVQTIFNKNSLADSEVFKDNDLFNFFAAGVRFGHYKLSGTDDRAPQLISYLDITRGRWQNLERRIDTGEKNNAGEPIFVRRRPFRWALEGRLKIPAMPFLIGFDSNIGEGPDDLRFLFGTNFDVAQLFNLLR